MERNWTLNGGKSESHVKLKLTFTKVSNFYIIFSHANICVTYVKYKLCVVTSHLKVRFA